MSSCSIRLVHSTATFLTEPLTLEQRLAWFDDRQGIEQLDRYITRPAISNERLSINRECKHAHSAPVRMTWARLLKRVFEAADFTRRAARVSRGKRAVRRNLRAESRRSGIGI